MGYRNLDYVSCPIRLANEGFLLHFPSLSLFVFSRYSIDSEGQLYSECDKTMVGWYSPNLPLEHSNWGCFYGLKEESAPAIRWEGRPKGLAAASFLQTEAKYEELVEIVAEINESGTTWKAGISVYFTGLTLPQVHSRLGIPHFSPTPVFPASPQSFPSVSPSLSPALLEQLSHTDPDSLTAFLSTPLESIPVESLPTAWDWSDIDGRSYLPSGVISQGSCGSCYIVATMQMLESRMKIQTNGLFDKRISAQFPLACNFYTEGCAGGYATLVARFISEFGVPLDECVPYQANDFYCDLSCPDNSTWIGIDSYGYLGGFHGACTEELMRKELRARGPFVVSIEPNLDFTYYKEGIYQSKPLRPNGRVNMMDMGVAWEQVDHSLVVVGWGEEDGVKYWKVLNSWGEDWGEHGFFRILRGVDDSSVESNGQVASPIFLSP